jgi:hypothetical protein
MFALHSLHQTGAHDTESYRAQALTNGRNENEAEGMNRREMHKFALSSETVYYATYIYEVRVAQSA